MDRGDLTRPPSISYVVNKIAGNQAKQSMPEELLPPLIRTCMSVYIGGARMAGFQRDFSYHDGKQPGVQNFWWEKSFMDMLAFT